MGSGGGGHFRKIAAAILEFGHKRDTHFERFQTYSATEAFLTCSPTFGMALLFFNLI